MLVEAEARIVRKQDRIERQVVVPAPIERVWRAITSADELARWFGDIAEIDLTVGGSARFGWSDHGRTFEAVIEAVEPPARLAFRWAVLPDTAVDESPSTLVEYTLETVEDGTRVRVLETGFADLPDEIHREHLDENTAGWKAELTDLLGYLRVSLEV